jgi:hypothetical protein
MPSKPVPQLGRRQHISGKAYQELLWYALVEWIEVEFSDGSKKSVAYNQGSTPQAIAKAMQKINLIETKQNRHP